MSKWKSFRISTALRDNLTAASVKFDVPVNEIIRRAYTSYSRGNVDITDITPLSTYSGKTLQHNIKDEVKGALLNRILVAYLKKYENVNPPVAFVPTTNYYIVETNEEE